MKFSILFPALLCLAACSSASEENNAPLIQEKVVVESKNTLPKDDFIWACTETECCKYLVFTCEAGVICPDNIVVEKCVPCKEKRDGGYKCPKRFEGDE